MKLPPRPTYANVMATGAMFVALGGVGYAASDGFWAGGSYSAKRTITSNEPSPFTQEIVFCDPGDDQIGGGFSRLGPEDGTVITSAPFKASPDASGPVSPGQQGWIVEYANEANARAVNWVISVRCADFAPDHRR